MQIRRRSIRRRRYVPLLYANATTRDLEVVNSSRRPVWEANAFRSRNVSLSPRHRLVVSPRSPISLLSFTLLSFGSLSRAHFARPHPRRTHIVNRLKHCILLYARFSGFFSVYILAVDREELCSSLRKMYLSSCCIYTVFLQLTKFVKRLFSRFFVPKIFCTHGNPRKLSKRQCK